MNQSEIIISKPQLGFPVLQPYFNKESEKIVNVRCGTSTIHFHQSVDFLPHYGKHITAFPPNYIHSMDASHLLLSALKFKERGLETFGSVHDSYWGHACDMDALNISLRESFIELYKENRLESLYLDLSCAYAKPLKVAGISIPLPPSRGDFNIEEVLDAPYFFA